MEKLFGEALPVGKLPAEMLRALLASAPADDPRIVIGPGIGLDCAVVKAGQDLLVFKSDPITFATQEIGWYAVQVNANDIATSGAVPRWMMATLLLPEKRATEALVEQIFSQIYEACRQMNIAVIGGHTEITASLERPIVIGTMIGEVASEKLMHPGKVHPGDDLLLTKGVPIEATGLLAREFSERMVQASAPFENFRRSTSLLTPREIKEAQEFIYHPGISVLADAQIALQCGGVHAMHDPTEGGLYTAIWEFAEASKHSMLIEKEKVPVFPLSRKICHILNLDPLGAIASGALLMAVDAAYSLKVQKALQHAGIPCAIIGRVLEPSETPQAHVMEASGQWAPLPRPHRDEIARLFEAGS